MRKNFIILFIFCFTTFLSTITVQAQKTKNSFAASSPISILNGGWQRIAIGAEGKPVTNPLPQFRIFHDGYFSMIGQDSTGAWKTTFGGTYEIDGNLYKEKMLYCSNPDLIGTMHWQEFNLRGDTLVFITTKKVINGQGMDVTASMRKREIICVRAKR